MDRDGDETTPRRTLLHCAAKSGQVGTGGNKERKGNTCSSGRVLEVTQSSVFSFLLAYSISEKKKNPLPEKKKKKLSSHQNFGQVGAGTFRLIRKNKHQAKIFFYGISN